MKYTVVPAQVTTVEDRIAGSLGLSQLMLLIAPVFGDSALYVLLPPNMHNAPYKLVVMVLLLLVCGLLAIRIKGKILLLWLVVIVRYNSRPGYYLFNKNSLAGREQYEQKKAPEAEPETSATPITRAVLSPLSTAQVTRLQALMENPAAHLTFKVRKGGLRVHITEVKEPS